MRRLRSPHSAGSAPRRLLRARSSPLKVAQVSPFGRQRAPQAVLGEIQYPQTVQAPPLGRQWPGQAVAGQVEQPETVQRAPLGRQWPS